ncbi:MAG: GNAT family N-acyltransferase [Rhizobacter sp.]
MYELQLTPDTSILRLDDDPVSRPAEAVVARDTRLDVHWAESEADVREAQRLRHRVFVGEMGARLTVPPGTLEGVDADRFDPFCEHLLVRAIAAGDNTGPVVGTYRLLTPSGARRAGGGYTDTEFDLSSLAPLRPRAVELGRSCVHPDWRRGGVILLLWTALSRFMVSHGLDTMIGCASIALDRDGDGAEASALWHRLRHTHMASAPWSAVPRLPLPLHPVSAADARVVVPPLIKGYLRCGTKVLGAPAFDAAFNVADLPMMARLNDLPTRFQHGAVSD